MRQRGSLWFKLILKCLGLVNYMLLLPICSDIHCFIVAGAIGEAHLAAILQLVAALHGDHLALHVICLPGPLLLVSFFEQGALLDNVILPSSVDLRAVFGKSRLFRLGAFSQQERFPSVVVDFPMARQIALLLQSTDPADASRPLCPIGEIEG